MSGHPQQGGHYDDDGYGQGHGHQQAGQTDSYYQDNYDQAYHDNNAGYGDQYHGHQQGGDGYYDES